MIKRLLSFFVAGLLSLILVAEDVGVSVNGVDVSAGFGVDWSYANPTLKLSGAGPFVLHGTNTEGEVQVTVNADSTVVLSNLHLRANGTGQCAFQITTGKRVELLLVGTNELWSGSSSAGLQVPAGASVYIDRAYETRQGALKAYAASQGGAGIGSPRSGRTGRGNIYIRGGQISAEGGEYSAGIGGAYRNSGSVGETVISGGTVLAKAGDSADDIGGYNMSSSGSMDLVGAVAITGGSVHAANNKVKDSPTNALGVAVHRVTVIGLAVNTAVELKDLDGYGDKDIIADGDGRVYLWLTNGDYKFQVSQASKTLALGARVVDGPTLAYTLEEQPVGVCVDGEDIGLQEDFVVADWLFDAFARELFFTEGGSFVVSGSNTLDKLTFSASQHVSLKFLDFVSEGVRLWGPIEIAGGTLTAVESHGPLIITGGSVTCGSFAVEPSNGVERVWCVTVPNLTPNAAVEVTGLADYGTEGLVADANGRLYLWLSDGDYIFRANGSGVRAIVEGADVQAVAVDEVTPTGVTVNGVDVAYEYGPGWTYAAPVLSLTNTYEYVLSGTNEAGVVEVSVRADARVVVSDLVLVAKSGSPMSVLAPCRAEIVLTGNNLFQSDVALKPGLYLPSGAEVVIQSYTDTREGCLSIKGALLAVGVGGGYGEAVGGISVKSGTVVVTKGDNGSYDIGGAWGGTGATVVISGGSVKATAIDKAPVNAQGTEVYCVTVPGLTPNTAVTVTGLGNYGVDGLVADAAGQIYLWLPNGGKAFTAGGRKFAAMVAGTAVTAVDQGPATEVVLPTELVITSFSIANGVANLEITTDLLEADFTAWLSTVSFVIDFREEIGGAVVETLTPTRAGAVLTVTLPSRPQGFLVVRALNH